VGRAAAIPQFRARFVAEHKLTAGVLPLRRHVARIASTLLLQQGVNETEVPDRLQLAARDAPCR